MISLWWPPFSEGAALLRQGTQALRQQEGDKAEQVLNQALQEEPEASDWKQNVFLSEI